MAYFSKQNKASKLPAIKKLLKEYNIKGSLSVYHHSTVRLTIQESAYDFLFVQALNTGAEFREGETTYLAMLDTKVNQARDLAIEDYNSETAYFDGINQSLLLESKGVGENFKGKMTANTQYMKAVGSMFGNYQSSGSILSS